MGHFFKKRTLMTLIIFGFDGCPYCRQAKKACDMAGIPYKFIDIDNPKYQEMWNKMGHTGVPVVYLNDKYMGGLNALKNYIASEETNQSTSSCSIM
jgi:glutaredoxin